MGVVHARRLRQSREIRGCRMAAGTAWRSGRSPGADLRKTGEERGGHSHLCDGLERIQADARDKRAPAEGGGHGQFEGYRKVQGRTAAVGNFSDSKPQESLGQRRLLSSANV